MADIDRAVADKLLTTTRSVRKRLDLDRAVDPRVVFECLEIATQAPSGSNLQRWRWVVVTDPDKRAAIGDIYRRAISPYHDIMQGLARPDDRAASKVLGSSRYLEEVLGRVPVHVIPCALGKPEDMKMLLGATGYPHEISDNLAATSFYGSLWPAVWSFMLALRARGLGSSLTTMHLALEREVGDLLGIPETVSQVGLIPVAYYTGESFKPAARRPIDQIAYLDNWKSPPPSG